jgi:hypothetical protein
MQMHHQVSPNRLLISKFFAIVAPAYLQQEDTLTMSLDAAIER